MSHNELEEDTYDADRYDSAAGYEPPYQHQKLLDDYRKKNPFIHPSDNLLDVRPANEWLTEAEYEPPAAKLFGDLWKEGELAIMFADTGTGKSILAVQIAESIARGPSKSSPPYEGGVAAVSADGVVLSEVLKNTSPAQKVLYLDFELSSAQFFERYSSRHNGECTVHNDRNCALCTVRYKFSPNLLRSEIKWDDGLPEAFKNLAEFMLHSIIKRLDETEAKVLVVDNISYLNTANTNANSALTLMKALKHIKSDFGISILVLAHTPKRPITKPMTVNDLAGSKMLANFADNLFAIGTSIRSKDLRYIKHIKQRNCPAIYDASNVIVCRIEKMASPVENGKRKVENAGTRASLPAKAANGGVNSSPPYEGGVASASDDGVVLSVPANSQFSHLNSHLTPKPFLGFAFIEFDDERHHTTRPYDTTNADRAKLIAAAKELSAKGHTQREIAEALGLGKGTVGRYLSDDTNAEACVAEARTQ